MRNFDDIAQIASKAIEQIPFKDMVKKSISDNNFN